MKKAQTERAPQTKWIQVPENLKLGIPFIRAVPLRPIGNDAVEYEAITDRGPLKLEVKNNASFMVSSGEIFDDMCNMDILNEPQILNNLVQRYKSDKIFTFIGPTLIVVNPYRIIPEYFSNQTLGRIRQKILAGTTNTQKPHIYLIAGNAYISMIDQQKKQAIVISGESGAGKTESTKYCMQILTSLSHRQTLPIEAKILACNPILQAFGNSKTLRNDNSSRFGKYVQIFFTGNNTIVGASIHSYLLQKSRVVSTAQKERSFHVFYALVASGTAGLQKASHYNYLSKSKCYDASGINDKQYFFEIKKSMKSIGFSDKEEGKIWELLISILELGNIEFDDKAHKQSESKPCQIKNKKQMEKVAKILGVNEPDLQKILLFEKKKFLKDITFSPYNKSKCLANINTLSKAIYNAIFEFILFKIQKSLKPEENKNNYLSINILDIFGFQNFDLNSFQQFCINYTNEKLLKLYNKYVFEKEMEILKQDGLYEQVASIKPPTNDAVIQVISGKLSLFSIINDLTMPQQFKDNDIIQGFEGKLSNSPFLKFDKINKSKFIIVHSQCNVKYEIQGFKQKNQDRVLPQISDIVNNLFQHDSRDQSGKTLLTKFSTQIQELMHQLNSSCVHFIRCIKPNEKKMPHVTQQQYMITQIRYLGVFETIQIRKKTFPSRWLYEQFLQRFQSLFPLQSGTTRTKTQKILRQLTNNQKQYLLGNKRVYMNPELETKLSKKLHEQMKKKLDAGKKILKSYRKYKFKKQIRAKLKLLVKRIRIWKSYCEKQKNILQKEGFVKIKETATFKKQQERILMNKKLMEAKQKREEEEKKLKQLNASKRNENQLKYCQSIISIITKMLLRKSIKKIKGWTPQKTIPMPKADSTAGKSTKIAVDSLKSPQLQQNYMSNMSDSMLNESIVIDDRNSYRREEGPLISKKTNFQFNQSFAQEKSILLTNDKDIVFEGSLQVPMFSKNEAQSLQKLRLILNEKYQVHYNGSEEDFFSPPSDDSNFQIQQTEAEMMDKIVNFDSKQFFKQVLRKRTNFFGVEKDEDDILVCKTKQLNKSLTLISESDQKEAIRIFKSLLKISEEAKLQNVFKLIEVLIGLCHGTTPQLKNQIFLQMIKQSNTDLQLPSVRILQTLAVFLHIFSPDKNFIIAGLNFFFKKLAEQRFSEKQNQYIRYNFKKMLRKLEKPHSISYMPIKYQMMALMCKRKISLPVYLPIGSSVLIRVESYETFGDIKNKVIEQLGINNKRLIPDLFSFFQIVNFDNQELEQSPILESAVVWDTITYWQKAKDKYKQKGILPPIFFLMLKIKFTFQCHYSDQQAVQIMYGQAYFEYFVGRLQFQLEQLSILAACVKKLKFSNTPIQDFKGSYPAWALKKFSQSDMISKLKKNFGEIEKQHLNEYDIKFKFLSLAAKNPLCMSLVIGTDQNVKIYLKPKKIMLTDKNEIVEQIPIKSITKFADEGDKLVYSVRGSNQNKVLYTEHSTVFCNYLSTLPKLVKIRSNSANILGDLN